MSKSLRVFVLADTHNKLPPQILELAKDGDEIWHLGDVCNENIVDELRALGRPVTVVRGNCDANYGWPLTANLVRAGIKFRLQHIPPERTPEGVDVVLHGPSKRKARRSHVFEPWLRDQTQSRSSPECSLA